MNKQSPIIILHTNDIHGRVEELARIATLLPSFAKRWRATWLPIARSA